jgi:hypothetical protein
MAEFVPVTASSGPRIKDLCSEAVEETIARFFFDPDLKIGTAFDPHTGAPFLFLYGYAWPEAWEVPIGMPRDEFDPYTTEEYEEGDDGFIELLKALAIYLEEPLTVQAIGHTKCQYPLAACQWHIEPGSNEVVIGELGATPAQACLAASPSR